MHDQQKVVISFVIFNFSFRTLKTAVYAVGQIFLGLYCFNQLARFLFQNMRKATQAGLKKFIHCTKENFESHHIQCNIRMNYTKNR